MSSLLWLTQSRLCVIGGRFEGDPQMTQKSTEFVAQAAA